MSEALPATAPLTPPTRGDAPRAAKRTIGGDLREVVAELWEYRDLLHQLTLRDVKIRYKQAIMGYAWALFMPGLIVLAGLLVRVAMAHLSGSTIETASMAGVAMTP